MAELAGKRDSDNSGILGAIEWKTLSLVVLCYGVWLLAGMAWSMSHGWLLLPLMGVCAAFHSSLQHETIHGHPTRWNWFNELLVSLPLIVVFPYRRYRALHLKHHNDINLTDPYEDPESYYFPLHHYQAMRPWMRAMFAINNTLVGRLILGPWLSLYGFARTELMRLLTGEPGVRRAWLCHIAGLAALVPIVALGFGMPFWVYFLLVAYPGLALTSLRSYAEHQAAEQVGARSAIVETNPALALLYLNNNLHIVHHASPATPWYGIPALYRERREQYLTANGNYLFAGGYGEVFCRFAFRIRQPVDHPFLYRELPPPNQNRPTGQKV